MAEQLERVLVVDDEPNLRKVICRFLETRGFAVAWAENGKEALVLLDEQPFDLVLTDVYMPVLDGEELVASINARFPTMPIIAMTGFPEVEKAVKMMRSGVTDYLRKPLQLSQLETVIRGALAKRSMPCAEVGVDQPLSGSLGGYTIIQTLGKGSMGIVYKVQRTGGPKDQFYALKVLDPGPDTEQNRLSRERFLREAEIARSIVHDNIVKLVDFGTVSERGIPYMVMEYVEGRSLESLIESRAPLDYVAKTRILRQVANALDTIHQHQLLHRDIKPGNIIVTATNRAKLTDFGLARVPGSDLTATQSVVGTPAYLAPESYREGIVDERVDLFALGVVAYELYVGHRPFDAMVFSNLVLQIEKHLPVEPRKLDPGLPIALQLIVARLMRKQPAARYQSAAAVVRDLDAWLSARHNTFAKIMAHLRHFRCSDWR